MNINLKKLFFNITFIYITLKFIIYTNNFVIKSIDYIYLSIMMFLILAFFWKNKVKIAYTMFFIIILFCVILITQILFNSYGFSNIANIILFAVIAFLLFKDNDFFDDIYLKKINPVYLIICIYLIYYIIESYLHGYLGFSTTNFYLPTLGDKNWSSLVIFLFLILCYKRKYILGSIISLVYIVLLNSRMGQIAVILFMILEFSRRYPIIKKVYNKICKINVLGIFVTIIISQLLIIGISYYCVYYIPKSEISDYRESIMDNSNAMRVRSNVYAMNEIIKNPKLLISGYDNQIKEKLGVADTEHSTTYEGFRLVQPHSLLLNLILRYGIIFSAIYLIFISYIIKKYISNDNLSFIIIYIFMNMILHSLFSYEYLIYFFFVLSISKRNEKRKINICRY